MFASEIPFCNLMMISGKKWGSGWGSGDLKVDLEQKVSTKASQNDVLLRKRA